MTLKLHNSIPKDPYTKQLCQLSNCFYVLSSQVDQNSALESRPNASLKISTKPHNLATSRSLKLASAKVISVNLQGVPKNALPKGAFQKLLGGFFPLRGYPLPPLPP